MKKLLSYWQALTVIAIILFICCLVGIIAIGYNNQARNFWANQQAQLNLTAQRCSVEVKDWVSEKSRITSILVSEINRGVLDTQEEYETQLRIYADADIEIENTYVGFEDNTLYASTFIDKGDRQNVDCSYYKAGIQANGAPAFTEPYVDQITNKLVVTIAQKTTDQYGRTCVVGLDISLEDLKKAVYGLDTSKRGGAWLISKQGNVLSSPDPLLNPSITNDKVNYVNFDDVNSSVNVLEDINTYDSSGVHIQRIVDYDGVEKFEATTSIPTTGWLLGVNIPLSDYDDALNYLVGEQFPLIVLAIVMSLICIAVAAILNFREKERRKDQNKLMDELCVKNDQLADITNHDPLTNAFNRRYLTSYLHQCIYKYTKENPICVLMLDIDHFKYVNDHYGHQAGDEVLKKLALEVDRTLRSDDVLARVGGEEFIAVLNGVHASQAYEVAERIRNRIESLEIIGIIKITISVGIIEIQEGESVDKIMKRVDNCLSQAKRTGRNKCCGDKCP